MSAEKITAEPRTEFGKGAARRIRREDKIPAVVYGHGNDPMHVTLPGSRHDDGAQARRRERAARARHRRQDPARADQAGPGRPDPPRPRAHRLRRRPQGREGHRRRAASHLVGEAVPETLVVTENATVAVEAEATHIPEYIEVSDRGRRGRHPDPRLRPRSCPRAHAADRPGDADRQRHPARRPPRSSRPSWPRPRPRPASSTRSPTRSAEAAAERRGRRRPRVAPRATPPSEASAPTGVAADVPAATDRQP